MYCASSTVEGCQAGGLGYKFQYVRECNAESTKQGSKSSILKEDETLCLSGHDLSMMDPHLPNLPVHRVQDILKTVLPYRL